MILWFIRQQQQVHNQASSETAWLSHGQQFGIVEPEQKKKFLFSFDVKYKQSLNRWRKLMRGYYVSLTESRWFVNCSVFKICPYPSELLAFRIPYWLSQFLLSPGHRLRHCFSPATVWDVGLRAGPFTLWYAVTKQYRRQRSSSLVLILVSRSSAEYIK